MRWLWEPVLGLVMIPVLLVATVVYGFLVAASTTYALARRIGIMMTLATFDVLASVQPDGRARRVNVLNHKTFKTINDKFDDHNKWRWLIVVMTDETVVRVMDLWHTEIEDEFPYVSPWFIREHFEDVDQAIGYIALHLC